MLSNQITPFLLVDSLRREREKERERKESRNQHLNRDPSMRTEGEFQGNFQLTRFPNIKIREPSLESSKETTNGRLGRAEKIRNRAG